MRPAVEAWRLTVNARQLVWALGRLDLSAAGLTCAGGCFIDLIVWGTRGGHAAGDGHAAAHAAGGEPGEAGGDGGGGRVDDAV